MIITCGRVDDAGKIQKENTTESSLSPALLPHHQLLLRGRCGNST